MKNHLSSNIYREEVVSRTSTFVDGFSKHVAFQLIHINYFPSREIAPSSIISEKLRANEGRATPKYSESSV